MPPGLSSTSCLASARRPGQRTECGIRNAHPLLLVGRRLAVANWFTRGRLPGAICSSLNKGSKSVASSRQAVGASHLRQCQCTQQNQPHLCPNCAHSPNATAAGVTARPTLCTDGSCYSLLCHGSKHGHGQVSRSSRVAHPAAETLPQQRQALHAHPPLLPQHAFPVVWRCGCCSGA